MAEPPRLSEIRLPWGTSIVYFVTLCVKGRRRVLANATVFEAIQVTVAGLRKWRLLAGVVMPDHVRFVTTPMEDRGLSSGDVANGFKRLLRKRLLSHTWEWQRGCFDRLLRSSENLHSTCPYLQENPVRAGLVRESEDWPSYLDFIDREGSYQLPPQEGGARK
jgi:REP element-mobilizing transposase RayT